MSEQEETTDEVEEVAAEFASMVDELDPEDRAIVLTELASRFCMSCGHNLDEDGDCPNEDCDDADALLDFEEEEEDGEGDEDEEDDEDDEDVTASDTRTAVVEDDTADDTDDEEDSAH
jgi:hypothetical protein